MKESLKRRLNVFLKLHRRLASVKWILLFITTVMFFLSAASSTCSFSLGVVAHLFCLLLLNHPLVELHQLSRHPHLSYKVLPYHL